MTTILYNSMNKLFKLTPPTLIQVAESLTPILPQLSVV